MFSFAHPLNFLLLFMPFAVLEWHRYVQMRKTARKEEPPQTENALYHPSAPLLHAMQTQLGGGGKKKPVTAWHRLLWWGGWIGLVVASMGPQWVEQEVRIESEGVDLVMAVDLSKSMLAMDFATNLQTARGRVTRLDVVKDVVEDFIAGRLKAHDGDRYGLVLFGNHAYVQTPLTIDGLAVAEMLKQTEVGIAGDATAIGDAIAMGVKLLKDRQAESRVLILLTDGSNTAGTVPPKEAARLAKQYGVRFYAIAVGNRDMVPYPEQTPFGERIVMARMEMDEEGLKELVEIAGGQYYRADSTGTLRAIYDRIDELEQTRAESHVRVIAEPLFRIPLIVGGVSFVLLLLLPYARRFHAKQGRQRVKSPWSATPHE